MTSPQGQTVTFLLTDIEGSTSQWAASPEAMRAALQRHDALLESPGPQPHNLPTQLTSFIGREQDLQELQTRLEDNKARITDAACGRFGSAGVRSGQRIQAVPRGLPSDSVATCLDQI